MGRERRDENDLLLTASWRRHFPRRSGGRCSGRKAGSRRIWPAAGMVRNGSVSWPTPIGARTGTMPAGVCPIFVPGGPANRARQAQTHQSREALNEQTSSPHHHLYPAQGGQRGGYRFPGDASLMTPDGWYRLIAGCPPSAGCWKRELYRGAHWLRAAVSRRGGRASSCGPCRPVWGCATTDPAVAYEATFHAMPFAPATVWAH